MTSLIRVTLRYDAGRAEIVRAIPIAGGRAAPSLEVEADSSGGWIEVLDGDGQVIHREALPDPHIGTEIFTRGKKLKRRDDADERIAAVELPWPGPGASLVVHARPPAGRTAKARATRGATPPPPSEIARLVPDPQPVQATRGTAPVAVKVPIWGHDNPNALTLVFMSEGFTAADMGSFRQMVDRCVHAFQTTVPFDKLLPNLAVATIELPSKDSGIVGTSPRDTPFRGRFQEGSLGRVILIDQQRASAVLDQAVPSQASALVVANTTTYGGSGGTATVFSCEPIWATEIAIHELGHSRFGLADEYDAAGQAATMKPIEPNVCGSAERAKLKWADMVAATTPLPTQAFGDPVPPGEPLGAYEGAKYAKEGVFRPAHDCKMRTPGAPFCPVCQRIIRTVLAGHAPA